jgi:topoisomerase-4 subunit A
MEQLFRTTDLEVRVPLNMNVLDMGVVPRVMSLREVLNAFIAHRRSVLERRANHRLEKIAARLDVLEGYLAVYLNLDKVIRIIRTQDEPRPVLIKTFKLTETQADAILNMRLRALRKLEEMEIRREHAALTKEQKALHRMLGSEKLKSDTLIGELRAIDAQFGQKTDIGRRRTEIAKAARVAEVTALAETVEEIAKAIPREPITVVCSQKGWLRALKGHQEDAAALRYRDGDRGRFHFFAHTTDPIVLLATDGRFYTLDASRLPGGRGQGEAIRAFIDMPPEADIVTMFVHVPGRRLLLASTSGHGFITNEDDTIAMTRKGKAVMTVKAGAEAVACHSVKGDHVAVIGKNHKLLIFPLSEVPELAKGQGVYLQRYSGSELSDAVAFTWKEGLKDANGRTFTPSELKDWKGARAQAGRLAPRGFSKAHRFADPDQG